MKKNIIAVVLGLILASGLFVGAGKYIAYSRRLVPAEPMAQESETELKYSENSNSYGVTDKKEFDKKLVEFIEENGYENKNYMISPTSFRAALAMSVAGADGNTKEELLHAMGFNSIEEVNEWYSSVVDSSEESAFISSNSIWRNTKANGKFLSSYKKYVAKHYDAKAEEVSPEKITSKVNDWVNKKTNGMIKEISSDLSEYDLLLINALYLKSSWVNKFYEGRTEPGDFRTFEGKTALKDFMKQQEDYKYYEDKNGKLVVIPMNGGVDAVFILGDIDDPREKMNLAKKETVSVRLPRFETESEFTSSELMGYLNSLGVQDAFNDKADYSKMCEAMDVQITEIIQKTKIKIDEEGVEAAAVTMVAKCDSCAMPEEKEIKEFNADEPFKYMIMTHSDDPELLFYGQIVE
ncbi:serpin B [Butyrivibrio sp. ob235]|uniref:serpin family protein n=1 Tax=Butyrivibrio sp. ob235 TaxID=1761780 RepID=UPI0008C2C1B9|nr:serpin family protein [Butyrivibrio sp. ob235]SEK25027.1 serpin B [Butyrivibrio sp. ob235]